MPFADIGHVKINYHVIGKGEPLVLISGLGTDHKTWIFQIPYFKEYFKVIVFDNRGMGKSTGSIGPYTTDLMADDTKKLIEHLKLEKVNVLGSSMGGMIAQKLAIKHPELIDRLVLCSTSAKPGDNILEILKEGLKGIVENEEEYEEIFEERPRLKIVRRTLGYFLTQVFSDEFIHDNKKLINDLVEEYVSNPRYYETFVKQVRAVHRHNTLQDLSKIKSETLVLTGSDDSLLPDTSSDLINKKIPNSKLVKMPGANHGVHYENSDEFNKIVLEFLKPKK